MNKTTSTETATVHVQGAEFKMLADLGMIVISRNYKHEGCLARFIGQHKGQILDPNHDLNDSNFPRPSRILRPGDRLQVRLFQHVPHLGENMTTSKQRMDLLSSEKAIYVGAQGIPLLYENRGGELRKEELQKAGTHYVFYDTHEHLYQVNVRGKAYHQVPVLRLDHPTKIGLSLGSMETRWTSDHIIVCFNEVV